MGRFGSRRVHPSTRVHVIYINMSRSVNNTAFKPPPPFRSIHAPLDSPPNEPWAAPLALSLCVYVHGWGVGQVRQPIKLTQTSRGKCTFGRWAMIEAGAVDQIDPTHHAIDRAPHQSIESTHRSTEFDRFRSGNEARHCRSIATSSETPLARDRTLPLFGPPPRPPPLAKRCRAESTRLQPPSEPRASLVPCSTTAQHPAKARTVRHCASKAIRHVLYNRRPRASFGRGPNARPNLEIGRPTPPERTTPGSRTMNNIPTDKRPIPAGLLHTWRAPASWAGSCSSSWQY